jgi:3-oxoacyl-[acyl-carrier protein] reductase
VSSGWFVTEINKHYLMSEAGQAKMRELPVRRFGTDGDLDGALLLLASDAGSYLIGTTVVVDGGQLIALRG